MGRKKNRFEVIKTTDTGDVWKCPICEKKYHLIHTQPRRVLLIATFRSSYRSTYERNIRYFSVNDIPLFILKWGTRYYLYSIKRDQGGVINESK